MIRLVNIMLISEIGLKNKNWDEVKIISEVKIENWIKKEIKLLNYLF